MKNNKVIYAICCIFLFSIFVNCGRANRSEQEQTTSSTESSDLGDITEDSMSSMANLDKGLKEAIQKEVPADTLKKQEVKLFDNLQSYIKGDTTKKQGKVLRGSKVLSIDEMPWQVALIIKGSTTVEGLLCGGSIIDGKWILTAAHCFIRDVGYVKPHQIQIFSGSVNLGPGGKKYDVKRILLHPYFNDSTLDNDVALIELNTSIKFSDDQRPISLPVNDAENKLLKEGLPAIVSGWGVTENGLPSSILRKLNVRLLSDNNSKEAYGESITSNMLCAGNRVGDTCNGDSGGPLTVKDNNGNPVLIGLVSWGPDPCGDPNKPGVYTKVHNYINWIDSKCGCIQQNQVSLNRR